MKAITKEKLKKKLLSTGKFISDNRWMFFKMGIMAAIMVAPDVGLCQVSGNSSTGSATAGSMSVSTGIDALNSPLQKLGNALTGPIPAVFTIVSGAIGGLSWGMGWEQQITQRALKCVGGGAVAMGAGGVMSSLGIGAEGFLFM